jgi:DNA processing protein
VAVLGSGHGRLYPAAHRPLADEIVATGGAVISELAPGVSGTQGTFPRRNRLISGLAGATVVIEAPVRSGALITAAHALEQGRECFLVPGQIGARQSEGCLRFLRENHGQARIVASVADLLDDLGFDVRVRPASHASVLDLGPTEERLASLVVAGHSSVDRLVAETGLPVATVLSGLTLLEMRGLIAAAYGRYRPIGVLLPAVEARGQGRRRAVSGRSRDDARMPP